MVGGGVATAATAVAAGVTFGQIDGVNRAVGACANFTAKNGRESTLVKGLETVGGGVVTAGCAVGAAVTLGQVEAVNNALAEHAQRTGQCAAGTATRAVRVVDGVTSGLPVVGHVKGGIQLALGDKEGGQATLLAATRTTGVIGGGLVGIAGGPAGMVAGGMAGGVAMDGLITGAESLDHGEYRPHGSLEAWRKVANAESAEDVVGGIVDSVLLPVGDGLVGLAAGSVAVAALEEGAVGSSAGRGGGGGGGRGGAPGGGGRSIKSCSKSQSSSASPSYRLDSNLSGRPSSLQSNSTPLRRAPRVLESSSGGSTTSTTTGGYRSGSGTSSGPSPPPSPALVDCGLEAQAPEFTLHSTK